jgi:iron complex outermembrane receptor protein
MIPEPEDPSGRGQQLAFRGEGAGIRFRSGITASLLVLVVARAAGADERLGEVLVTAPPISQTAPPGDATAFATVIDTRSAPTLVETLSDALADTVGVQVRRFGGLGDFTTVSVRGFSPRQVQVYLDGVPLARADNDTVDLSDLPLDTVERVEVYRGSTPLRFAQAGPGGVINVVTRSPGSTPVTAASASYGSFETRKVDLTRSASDGNWDYLVFGHYLGTKGNFTFTEDNGTPENPADDREVTRINNDFNLGSLTARVGWRPYDGVSFALTSDTFGRDRGYPGRGVPQDPDARRQTVRHLTRVDGIVAPRPGLPLTIEASAWLLYQWQAFEDPLGPVIQLTSDVRDRSLVGGGQLLFHGAIGSHQVPGLLLAVSHETFGQTDEVGSRGVPPGTQPDRTRLRGTVAGENEILLLGDRVSIVPGLRWEGYHDEAPPDPRLPAVLGKSGTVDLSVWSPRLGLRAEAWPGVTLLGNAGRYERVPTLQELFGDAGVVVGNPALRPEKSINWDLGFRLARAQLGPAISMASFEFAYFDNRIDDVIVVVPTSVSVFTSRNISAASVTGQEVSLAFRLWERVGIAANYTHQNAIDESNVSFRRGNQLPGRPAHEAYLHVELPWNSAHPLPVGALGARLWPGRVWGDVNIIADNFLNTANTELVPQRNLFSLGFEVRPLEPLRVSFEVRNLTNDQTRDALDFPLPGRSFYTTVSWGF